jgi:lipopolysaccharide transport system permease protein
MAVLIRLWKNRYLVASLIRRTYQVRYRQSLVGYWWAILPPLGMLAVGFLVFDRVAGVDPGKKGYALVTMAALLPWNLFANSLVAGVPIIAATSTMVTRLAFPRAVLPLSVIGTSLLGAGISSLLFLAIAFITGQGLPATAVWFPALVLIELVFIAGILFLGSALDVFARDVRLAVPIVAQLWLLATPVMYPLDSVKPESLRQLYMLNPMTGVTEAFRQVLVFGNLPGWDLLMPVTIGAVACFVVGAWYFGATERRFADAV